jgi:sugar lactone lactonase YvrE
MWFTQPYPDTRPTIGRITTDGVITKFRIPTPESRPTSITAGPDGNLWFTEPDAGKVGRITPQGVVTEFSGRDAVSPDHITPGRDGRLWFADIYYGDVYTITTDGQVAPNPIPVPSSFDKGIEALVATPADTMWLAGRWEYLASVDRSHEVTEYPVRDQSIGDLVLAPGGDLWFSNGSEVARIDRDWNAVLSLDTGFLPRVMSVGLGERVRWQATGARPVQIQADGGGFDSGALVIGERYLRRFASAGSFPYHDPADGRDGVVRVPMSATASGSPTMIALQWSVLPPTGDRFDVQVLVPGATAWTSLRSVTADVAGSFEPASGPGVYRFRARTRSDASVSGWSRGTTVTV